MCQIATRKEMGSTGADGIAENVDPSKNERQEAGHCEQSGGVSCSVRTNESDTNSRLDFEIHLVDSAHQSTGQRQFVRFQK